MGERYIDGAKRMKRGDTEIQGRKDKRRARKKDVISAREHKGFTETSLALCIIIHICFHVIVLHPVSSHKARLQLTALFAICLNRMQLHLIPCYSTLPFSTLLYTLFFLTLSSRLSPFTSLCVRITLS